MEVQLSTTPFGRPTLALAREVSQPIAPPPGKPVRKRTAFQHFCAARSHIDVSEQSLAALHALLNFRREAVLASDLSNYEIFSRALARAPASLRPKLALLHDDGPIVRRDCPNGKRFTPKGREGEIPLASGVDLSPIIGRTKVFALSAEEVRAEEGAPTRGRDIITVPIGRCWGIILLGDAPRRINASTSRQRAENYLLFAPGRRAGDKPAFLSRTFLKIERSILFAFAPRARRVVSRPPPMRVGLRQSGSSLSQGGHSNEVSTSASWRDRRPAAIL
jgi:Replication protein C N-terminal domain